MATGCSNPDCTVAQTGKCLLNNAIEDCPHLQASSPEEPGLPPVLTAPIGNARLPASLTLDGPGTAALASRKRCTQVGILGFPDSGKTAALVSLYLLVARGLLRNFEFRDSQTLLALEMISRGARRWDATSLPEQLTSHTESADGRTAGYLHLRLWSQRHVRQIDLLLPDLPGEWTTTLADQNRTDRLQFLSSCSAIWLFVDGRQVRQLDKRLHAIHRAELVLRRLAAFLGPSAPQITLVVTHKDSGPLAPAVFANTLRVAEQIALRVRVLHIASFTVDEGVASAGEGLSELIDGLCESNVAPTPPIFESPRRTSRRQALNVREILR